MERAEGCQHLVTLEVTGRPATFATAHEAAWKEAVRAEINRQGVAVPAEGRFSVRIEFRTAQPQNPNERWDIDNLVKPTLDAMEGVFGLREWRGAPQAADDRVDHLVARKRSVRPGEEPGARIEVWLEQELETSSPPRANAELIRHALEHAGRHLVRSEDREPEKGLHEVRELGPALKSGLETAGVAAERVRLNDPYPIADWSRPDSEIDLVLLDSTGAAELAAELKAWDIGHQLFDLAKIGCLLKAGIGAGFLVCVAKSAGDFDRMAGGVLFPAGVGESRRHSLCDLINDYGTEWNRHIGRGRPEPTAVPTAVTTTTVAAGVEIAAYPGHSARAVEVRIDDPAPVRLEEGWPRDGECQ
jgi:Holliday junction resolvase RusA-like endonuclease